MEEFISVLEACWGADPAEFHGRFFDLPSASVNPKPLPRTHGSRPTLISGLWSQRGIERTIRRFDGWNPAGLPAPLVAERVATMNSQRSKIGRSPLSVWQRSFISFPMRPERAQPGLDGLRADLEASRSAGFDEFIVECNFWEAIDSPNAWADLPDRLAPLLR